jgi:hypothetical protein
MSKNRARLKILSELFAFPTINQKDWDSACCVDAEAQVGDLVSLTSALPSKWYVSWVREIKHNLDRQGNVFSTEYLLESIEDEALYWWSNVGLNIYNREKVKDRITWRWNDNMHAFNDRWRKACKRNDAFIVLPVLPVFGADNEVTLNVRIRFGWSDFSRPQTFANWKKLTIKTMSEFHANCKAEYEDSEKAAK